MHLLQAVTYNALDYRTNVCFKSIPAETGSLTLSVEIQMSQIQFHHKGKKYAEKRPISL